MLLTGCADGSSPSAEPTVRPSSESPGSELCTDFTVTEQDLVARADIDGDGKADDVSLVDRAPCHALVGRDRTSPLDTTDLGIVAGAAVQVVQPAATKRQLLLVSGQEHPRGGYQPYLVGEADDELGLVTFQGQPLLPFVATDTPAMPLAASCTSTGGLEVLTGEPTQDTGLEPKWDLTSVTYQLQGNVALATAQRQTEAVPDAQLRTEQPELFRAVLFADCVAG